MRVAYRLAFAVVCLWVCAPVALAAQRPDPAADARAKANAKRVAGFLDDSKFKYRKEDDGIWVVSFTGQHAGSIDVAVHARPDMVVVLCTVRKGVSLTAAQSRQMLEAAYHADYAKMAIDNDGDLMAMTELAADVTSGAFRNAVDEVASLADTAFGLLEASPLSAAVPSETFEDVRAANGAKMPVLRGAFELAYDPGKWKAVATTEPNVTQLNHVSGTLWLKVIAERLEVDPSGFRELALTNAKNTGAEIAVDAETWRTVNGLRVLVLRYSGQTSGVKFTFYNQMYGDNEHFIQLAGWTTTNLFTEHRRDLLELFAGLRKAQ